MPVQTERPTARRFTLGWPFGDPPLWARDFERTFGNLDWSRGFFPTLVGKGLGEAAWAPALEAFERNGQFVLRAELPGLRTEDVTVEVEENDLVIRGEREEEKEEKEPYFRSERVYGAFYRAVPIPEHVNVETVKASFENGILEVTFAVVPTAEHKPRHVNIDGPVAKAGKAA
jgi:HSP20 family protein